MDATARARTKQNPCQLHARERGRMQTASYDQGARTMRGNAMGVETEEQPVPKVFRGALLKPARALGCARVPPAVVAVSPETRSKLHPPTTAAAAGAAACATLRQSSFHGIGMHGLRTQPMIKLLVTSEVVSKAASASVTATNGANASMTPAAAASASSAASAAFVEATALTTLLRCRHRHRHT